MHTFHSKRQARKQRRANPHVLLFCVTYFLGFVAQAQQIAVPGFPAIPELIPNVQKHRLPRSYGPNIPGIPTAPDPVNDIVPDIPQIPDPQALLPQIPSAPEPHAAFPVDPQTGLRIGSREWLNEVHRQWSRFKGDDNTKKQFPFNEHLEDPGELHAPSPLGDYPARTPAEKHLERMLLLPDGQIDLAWANYLVSADLPAFLQMTPEDYSKAFSAASQQALSLMEKGNKAMASSDGMHDPSWPVYTFASSISGSGIKYPEKFQTMNPTHKQVAEMYRDERLIFLAGLLTDGRGACFSLPYLYVAVGQKMDLPVYFVHVGYHNFVRWEDDYVRLNIEATITDRVAVTDSDDLYLETEKVDPSFLGKTDELRNLTNHEIIGLLFHVRSTCWLSKGFYDSARRDIERAALLAPENQLVHLQLEQLRNMNESGE